MNITLRDGVHYCVANDRVAILDTVSDRYYCLPVGLEAGFRAAAQDNHSQPEIMAAIETLIERHILVRTSGQTPFPSPTETLSPEASVMETALSMRGLPSLHAMIAIHMSTARFKREPLHTMLSHIADRKRATRICHRDLPYDHLAAFLKMRRLISARDECLHQSVALVHYLAARRYFPTLVLGIRLKPFEAHAWVQHETVVLNETLDQVRRYTPILAI